MLVTGGAGFIGSNLAKRLVDNGNEVVVIDDLSSGNKNNVPDKAKFIQCDIQDKEHVEQIIKKSGVNIIVHLAAHRSVAKSVIEPLITDRVNTFGTLVILETARNCGVEKVISASSSSVYGGAKILPTPESTPLNPRSPYAVTKVAGEQYSRIYSELYKICSVSLRFFNVYGPFQSPDSPYAAVIPLFIDALLKGEPAQVHGNGLQSRDFTYISDVVDAIIALIEAPTDSCSGKVYNIAGGKPWSLLELLDLLGNLLGINPKYEFTSPRAGDILHSYADVSLAYNDFGFKTKIDFKEGLRKTIIWMKNSQLP